MNVACPFCQQNDTAPRGEGCCFCDYKGLIPERDRHLLLDPSAPNDEKPYPTFSDIDLKVGRDILSGKK